MNAPGYLRTDDFSKPLDACWEVVPDGRWTWEASPGRARLRSESDGPAEIYLRPCCLPGDTMEWRLVPGARRTGLFVFGFLAGFEYLRLELDLSTGDLAVRTHEFHKPQPRLKTRVPTAFDHIAVFARPSSQHPGT
ncbi:MAG: hypothetical protein HYU36_00835 [Planctomycetes bacterium]|nr:hypothetical protein [Planctomycetota bacterium]